MSATGRPVRVRDRSGMGGPGDERLTIQPGAAVAKGHHVLVGPIRPMDAAGRMVVGVVVDGWQLDRKSVV